MFESLPAQPFTDHALAAVAKTLRRGIFEFEVLARRHDGQYWAIDLNPRAFGQISLDIAQGRDLPVLWYESMTGHKLPTRGRSARPPQHWRLGVPFYAGALVHGVRGPGRFRLLRELVDLIRTRSTGAAMSWSDPLPALLHSLEFLRHPGGLIRPFFNRKDHR
jgi:predicted ATP-grasp superfamily ATP-dependent carboligase